MTDTMIERVAAAAEAQIRQYAAKSYGKVAPHARGTLSVDSEIDMHELARAAIEAIRNYPVAGTWLEAFDAALQETKG